MSFRINGEHKNLKQLFILEWKWFLMVIFAVAIISIFVADEWQQQRFANLRNGYEYMKTEQYNEAVTAFGDCLDVHSTRYWFILELVNDDRFSRENVMAAIQECNSRKFQMMNE